MNIPASPTSISTQPAACTFSQPGWPVTAKARMAPMATRARPVAVFMTVSLIRLTMCRWASTRAVVVGVPAEQAFPQVAQGSRLEAGHVHLGDAEPLADLGLSQVPVEAHEQDPPLTRRQLVPVRADRVHVHGPLQI